MPISAANRKRYPKDWPEISRRIRFDRAQGRCECRGECGVDHEAEGRNHSLDILELDRCPARHGAPHPFTKSKSVVLTTAHLPGREIEQCGDDDLMAACERCHNRMDAPSRQRNASKTRHRKRGQDDLFTGDQ